MAKTRNRALAVLQKLWVAARQERPSDLHRRLLRELQTRPARDRMTPNEAWKLFQHHARHRSFCSCGWLTQYGHYGEDTFTFSLVRQFDTLETWNDEYMQLLLELKHPVTPQFQALKSWNHWSSDYPDLPQYFRAVEANPGVQLVLANDAPWEYELRLEET